MKKTCGLLLMALLLSALPASAKIPKSAAGGACYTPEQMQAEQLLRLHSELMVVTVTCRTGTNGEDLPKAYGAFTQKNLTSLHGAEQVMGDYYRSHRGGGDPRDVDRLRTMLANEYGQKSADMSSTVFCNQYRDKVWKFVNASPADVENEVQRMIISERSFVKSCPAGTAAKPN